ncbi:unnamed protein product [Rotaria sordida]|uniref:Apoptotic chromatin condensation inducer in the nucleus n=1 Tax=Rotaria sordida TaxID=392033 RepID=A0A813V2H0_9BILA|nr:unnamed protein product [Rotaria sordida]CAF0850508.1 unnamed protein product [Rotaria sordida]CAF3538976.1 unnamed protein product [Rotaria sordida]
MMAEDQLTHIDTMTNVELRAELKRRGCSTSGNKKDLITKLHAALKKEPEQSLLSDSVEHPQNETPVIHTTLPIDDQATAQHPSVYTLSIPQDDFPSSAPIIPTLQQLPITSSVEDEQYSTINVSKVDDIAIVSSTFEKKTRARSKKSSIDSSSNENSNTTSNQQVINNEQNVLDISSNDNNVEMKPFVSKSIEEEQKDIEKIGAELYPSSVGNNSAKLESIIKEIPSSDEQQHSNQSKSEQQDNQSATIDEEKNSATNVVNDDTKNQNEVIDQSSDINLSADLKAATTEHQETTKEDESSSMNKPVEKAASQQLKTNQSQTSSLMKGLHRSTNNKINLSSGILKTLIPDISLLRESVINDQLDALINDQSNDNPEQSTNELVLETNITNEFLPCDSMTIGDLADQKQQTNRTVVMNIVFNSSSLNDDINVRKKQNLTSTHVSSFESKTSIDGKTNTIITDEPIRIRNITAINEPLSQILYISGLTRPFSLLQLKELLHRYGTLVDGQFWLNKIKSQCLVAYNTIEEAQNAREALDGCRWPSTNPKILSVRFAQQNELEFSKTHDLPPDQMSMDAIERIIQDKSNIIPSRRSPSPIDGIKSNTKKNHLGVREWNMSKLQEEKCSGFIIPEEKQEEESIKSNESPMKGLDEYFRKTKSKPSIYWLPLTEEQIIERNHRQEQRNAERGEAQKKQELDENIQISDSKSHRRLSPSQEKRKRSPSSLKRNSKRH